MFKTAVVLLNILYNFIKLIKYHRLMTAVSNFIDTTTLSSCNMQQKGQNHKTNSHRNKLYEIPPIKRRVKK